jgi:hypothetical protein
MKQVEMLAIQLYAKYGLEELRKPGAEQLDGSDVFSDAYLRAMQLVGGDGFDDGFLTGDTVPAIYAALVAELDGENLGRATRRKACKLMAEYFAPGWEGFLWGFARRKDDELTSIRK